MISITFLKKCIFLPTGLCLFTCLLVEAFFLNIVNAGDSGLQTDDSNLFLERSIAEESAKSVGYYNVSVAFYYETLCPYSIKYITSKANFELLRLVKYIDVQMVPYGNARET